MLDKLDVKILKILQKDCTVPVAEIGKEVGLSTTPCWRRIQKMEELGVIRSRVAILDTTKVNVPVTVFVFVTTNKHSETWLAEFHKAIESFPEVVEFYRMSGQVDYLLRVVVPDIASYDAFYKRLISEIDIADVSSSFAMEQIKFTTELPLAYARQSEKRIRTIFLVHSSFLFIEGCKKCLTCLASKVKRIVHFLSELRPSLPNE